MKVFNFTKIYLVQFACDFYTNKNEYETIKKEIKRILTSNETVSR